MRHDLGLQIQARHVAPAGDQARAVTGLNAAQLARTANLHWFVRPARPRTSISEKKALALPHGASPCWRGKVRLYDSKLIQTSGSTATIAFLNAQANCATGHTQHRSRICDRFYFITSLRPWQSQVCCRQCLRTQSRRHLQSDLRIADRLTPVRRQHLWRTHCPPRQSLPHRRQVSIRHLPHLQCRARQALRLFHRSPRLSQAGSCTHNLSGRRRIVHLRQSSFLAIQTARGLITRRAMRSRRPANRCQP